jgi:WS/DGAT C-terminal domain
VIESHPVVPIAEGHALSIGVFTHMDMLHFGLYADPEAFGQVNDLPRVPDTALRELLVPRAVTGRPHGSGRPHRSPRAEVAAG